MKRLTLLALVLVCLGLVFSISAGAEKAEEKKTDAKESFIQACKKPDETKGFHMQLTIKQDTGAMKQTIEMKGRQENPDKMYLEVGAGKQIIELYAQGDKAALRMSKKDKWQFQPKQEGVEMLPLKQILRMSQYIKDAKFIEEKEINKTKCQGVSIAINDEGLAKMANLEHVPKGVKVKFSDTSYAMWFNPKDLLPYRIAISYKVSIEQPSEGDDPAKEPDKTTIDASIECLLSDYDKDIEIALPDEVKELFEEKKKPEDEKEEEEK